MHGGFGERPDARNQDADSGVIDRLESGQEPARVAADLGLKPSDLIAALTAGALGSGTIDGPPLVRSTPGHPRLLAALSEPALAGIYPGATRPARLALAAGLLQVHDFWDASHHAAQEADDLGERRVSAYWHGIAHRREPDPGNAAYWFRRVGRHPLFAALTAAARPVLEASAVAPSLTDRLLPRNAWDPFAFIDLCAGAGPAETAIARKLQRLELWLLMEASLPD